MDTKALIKQALGDARLDAPGNCQYLRFDQRTGTTKQCIVSLTLSLAGVDVEQFMEENEEAQSEQFCNITFLVAEANEKGLDTTLLGRVQAAFDRADDEALAVRAGVELRPLECRYDSTLARMDVEKVLETV